MQRIALLLTLSFLGHFAAAEIISAKIQNNKLIIRTWQHDCNSVGGSLQSTLPPRDKNQPGTMDLPVAKFDLMIHSTLMGCQGPQKKKEVDLTLDLPEVSGGQMVNIILGPRMVSYKARIPQPNEKLTVTTSPNAPGAPMPGLKPTPNPGQNQGEVNR